MKRLLSAPLAASLAVAAAALAGCSGTPLAPADPAAPAPAAVATPGAPAPSSEAGAILEALPGRYRQDPMFRSCAAYAVTSCASQAVTRAAVSDADPAACDAVPDSGSRDSCRSYVATELAVANKDLAACARAGAMSGSCAAQAAARLASANGDPSWCQKLPAPDSPAGTPLPVAGPRDSCLYSAAMAAPAAKAKSLCDTVVDASMKKTCAETANARLEMEKSLPPRPPVPAPENAGERR